jgi:type II secretory pathway component PulK
MNQQGFVLVATLWVIAILTIGAGYFAERVGRAVELAQQTQTHVQDLVDMTDSRAEVLFRLATTPMSIHGLGLDPQRAIALDGRPYRGTGETLIHLQDNRGLINLNNITDDRLQRFLALLGLPSEQQGRLIDTLRDYTDPDNLKRLNGAERDDYDKAGLPSPLNAPLTTPLEARRILGWRDNDILWRDNALPRHSTTSMTFGLNPNTASWPVLASLPGVTDDIAKELVRMRQHALFISSGQIEELTGRTAGELMFVITPFPGDGIRITQTSSRLHWALEYNVTLTPQDENAPWRIDYFYRIPAKPDDIEHAQSLPPLATTSTPALPPFLSGP